MKSSLIINSIDANNQARQKSFPNINPNASNANVCTFAKKVNALTTNEFVSAIRVDKKPLDDSTPEPVIKQTPTLTLSEFTKDGTTYTATITYTGDGELTTTTGTIDDVTLIVETEADFFEGTITALETDNYLAATCEFSRERLLTPNLTVGYFKKSGSSLKAPITYDGDGTLSTNYGTISGSSIVTGLNSDFTGTITASETDNFKAASTTFVFGKYIYNSVNSGVKLSGSDKQDYIYNEKATVTIDSGAEIDYVYNKGAAVSIGGGAGNDTIYNDYSASYDSIDAGDGNDYVTNWGDNVLINAGAGNDSIFNGDSTVTIDAGDGNDSINNRGSYVSIDAGDGNDSITNEKANATIGLGAGDDYIYNSVDASLVAIDAGAGNDTIYNASSTVTIEGGRGDDTIYNGFTTGGEYTRGDSVIFIYHAGDGNDLISEFHSDSTLSIVGADYSTQVSGLDLLVHVGDNTITLQNALVIVDTLHVNNDEIILPAAVTTPDGDNTVYWRRYATLTTGDGNDSIYTGTGNSSIDAGAGDDTIRNNYGWYSTLNAGDGNDTIYNYSSAPHNVLDGGAGEDTITNIGDKVTIDAGDGDDFITNTGATVTTYGGAGNDTLRSGSRFGYIYGGTGDDFINLSSAATASANSIFYNLGDGNDTIKNLKARDTLFISGSTFTTTKSGNDVIVNVGSEYITIQGGATVSPLNIVSA